MVTIWFYYIILSGWPSLSQVNWHGFLHFHVHHYLFKWKNSRFDSTNSLNSSMIKLFAFYLPLHPNKLWIGWILPHFHAVFIRELKNDCIAYCAEPWLANLHFSSTLSHFCFFPYYLSLIWWGYSVCWTHFPKIKDRFMQNCNRTQGDGFN